MYRVSSTSSMDREIRTIHRVQLDAWRHGETDGFVHMCVCREIEIYSDQSGQDQNSLVPGNLEHIRVEHGGGGPQMTESTISHLPGHVGKSYGQNKSPRNATANTHLSPSSDMLKQDPVTLLTSECVRL